MTKPEDYLAISDAYYDEQNMFGQTPNPLHWSGGNEHLDTGTDVCLRSLLRVLTDEHKAKMRQMLVASRYAPGQYDKNPPYEGQRRADDITFDCILGMLLNSMLCEGDVQDDIYQRGVTNGWDLSNNGNSYFTAQTKPQHIASYTHAKGYIPSIYIELTLTGSFLINALFGMSSYSGVKLHWVMKNILLKSRRYNTPGNSYQALSLALLKWAIGLWDSKVRKAGGMAAICLGYYKRPDHPFVIAFTQLEQTV